MAFIRWFHQIFMHGFGRLEVSNLSQMDCGCLVKCVACTQIASEKQLTQEHQLPYYLYTPQFACHYLQSSTASLKRSRIPCIRRELQCTNTQLGLWELVCRFVGDIMVDVSCFETILGNWSHPSYQLRTTSRTGDWNWDTIEVPETATIIKELWHRKIPTLSTPRKPWQFYPDVVVLSVQVQINIM